jgi:hypothetical protein
LWSFFIKKEGKRKG